MNEPQTWADLQDVGNPQATLVLQAIARHAHWDTGECWPSHSTLARMAKCSTKTVQRYLDRLKADGIITVEVRFRDDGSQTSNLITLVGYAAWVTANRMGGQVERPKRIGCYVDAEPPGSPPPHALPSSVNQRALSTPLDRLSTPPVRMTTGPRHMESRRGGHMESTRRTSLQQSIEHTPLTPRAGGNSAKFDWKARALADLRATGCNCDGVENFVAPLLASDKRLALGEDPGATLASWAEIAQGVPAPALAAAVERLMDQKSKVTSADVREQIEIAQKAGAMVVIRKGTPQWIAWVEFWRRTEPTLARLVEKDPAWQAPAEFPPDRGRVAA